MVKLPANATLAALAIALGIVLGAGAYHVLAPIGAERVAVGALGGETAVYELGRYLQPRDTSSQTQPDVEIRYKTETRVDTIREVDSLFVPIPSQLGDPLISKQEPIDVAPNEVSFTAWDPGARRYEKRLYSVPDQRFNAALYAILRARSSPQLGRSLGYRVGAGVGGKVRYRSLGARVEATISPTLSPAVAAALTWRL